MSRKLGRWVGAAPFLAAALLAFPLGAGAASTTTGPPGVSTGGSSHERGTAAMLQGAVNPHGATTTYFFQYGPTAPAYGAQSPQGTLAAGFATVKVGQSVLVIHPGYHYRLVAHNQFGTTFGHDHVFTPKSTRLKFEFAKVHGAVTYGTALALSGALTGSASPNHRIQLQESPFPYLTAFTGIGLVQTTGATGRFAFRTLPLLTSTQFRVVTLDPLPLVSGVVTVRVAVKVTLKVRSSGRRGIVRLFGTVSPAEVGARVLFQLQKAGRPSRKQEESEEPAIRYATAGSTVVKRATKSISRFSAVLTLKHTGHYRAFVELPHGRPLVSGASSTILLRGAPEKPAKHGKH